MHILLATSTGNAEGRRRAVLGGEEPESEPVEVTWEALVDELVRRGADRERLSREPTLPARGVLLLAVYSSLRSRTER
jgi:hypothetical protein